MSRMNRCFLPGMPVHVIQRGNNRAPCFHAERDFAVYAAWLKECSERARVAVHSFVFMTNHVHLLVTPASAEGVSTCMQALGSRYVPYFNRVYGRTGTLWEGRFKAFLVDSDHYFHTVSCYIEQNPWRAGMVRDCAEYPWSSFQANALGKNIGLLTPHHLYQDLGKTAEQRQSVYRGFFARPLPDEKLKQIRNCVATSRVLGSEEFQREVERRLNVDLNRHERGGDRKSPEFRKLQSERASKITVR